MSCWSPLMLLLLGSIISLFHLPPPTSGLTCVVCLGSKTSLRDATDWMVALTDDEKDALKNPKKCADVSHAPANAVVTCEKLNAKPGFEKVKNWICMVYKDWEEVSGCTNADISHLVAPGTCLEDKGQRVCYCNEDNCNAKPLDYTIVNGVDTSGSGGIDNNGNDKNPLSPGNGKKPGSGPGTDENDSGSTALKMGVASGFGFVLLLPLGLILHFPSPLHLLLWGQ